ncbi:MarR family winged helix-turn-helix transcriptional regulator [Streptomyces sp. NPDC088725]|uniref:MarR family winged helix-turn-helix transcriptional regulator n=1 Tax=Streptomyces sp. NPDC088725 TaxID=3365873 RepID=UPI003825255B
MKNEAYDTTRAAHEDEPADNLSLHIKRAEQALSLRRAEAMRELDLTPAQCGVLGHLAGGASMSCTQLAREALVTSQTMNGIVSHLEEKGLVSRRVSPDHGRVLLVSLTPEGMERARSARRFSASVEQSLREDLSDADYELLVSLLDRVGHTGRAAGRSLPDQRRPVGGLGGVQAP